MRSRLVLTGRLAVLLGSWHLGCAARFDAAEPSPAAPHTKRTPFATSAPTTEAPAESPRKLSASIDALDPIETAVVKGVGPIAIAGIPKPPGYCPRPSGVVSKPGTCSDREKLFERLQQALRSTAASAEDEVCRSPWSAEVDAARRRIARRNLDVAKRAELDRSLAVVEKCAGPHASLVRVVRAHEWPECAQTLAEIFVDATTPGAAAAQVTLAGLAVSAQIDRIRVETSDAKWHERYDASSAVARLRQVLEPVVQRRLGLLAAAEEGVAKLPEQSYGRAVAELALSRAWSRSLAETPLGMLELKVRQAVNEERLRLTAPITSGRAQHLERASRSALIATDWDLLALWTKDIYGWPEQLRGIVLPAIASPIVGESTLEQLATRLPAWVSARLVTAAELTPSVTAALLQRGFDPLLRRELSTHSDVEMQLLVALARMKLGLIALQFDQLRAARNSLAKLRDGVSPRILTALAETFAIAPGG